MSECCVIITTYANEKTGRKIIDSLLRRKLAACIQTQRISSYYHWKGKVNNEDEYMAVIKTLKVLYKDVEKDILANHDYETPEIIELPVTDGSEGYLNWIRTECNR